MVVAVVAGVLIIGSAGFYLLTRASAGGRAQLGSLGMTVDYPSGWRDRTADESFIDDIGCGDERFGGVDVRCDVVLTKGDDSIFVVVSVRPPMSLTDADLAEVLAAAVQGSKVVEDIRATRIAGLSGYRATIEGSGQGGLIRRPEPHSFIVAIFQTAHRVAIVGAGSRQGVFERDRPQLEAMIASLQPVV